VVTKLDASNIVKTKMKSALTQTGTTHG
jgi:hypothetical protein